jgi:hypothetical protein
VIGCQNQVPVIVNQAFFALRVGAPQQKGNRPGSLGYGANDCVSQNLPALAAVAVGPPFFHGQASVEQQNAPVRPPHQTPTGHWTWGERLPQIPKPFFKNIA